MPIFLKRFYLLSFMAIVAVLFIIVALNFKEPLIVNFDEWLQSYLYDFLGSLGDFIFIVITYIGSGYIMFPILTILFFVFLLQKRYWTTLLLIFNLLGVRQLNWILKTIFERSRPELKPLIQVGSDSFPSGHAMNSIAFFGFFAYLFYMKLKGSGKCYIWVWVTAIVLVGIIGLSRVYLGVHYPSDVIGGFLAGGAWLLVSIFLFTFFPEKEQLIK